LPIVSNYSLDVICCGVIYIGKLKLTFSMVNWLFICDLLGIVDSCKTCWDMWFLMIHVQNLLLFFLLLI